MKPCKIKIKYDETVAEITGTREQEPIINENLPFVMMLHFIFSSYPKMIKRFPPGKLAFTLNNHPPLEFETLCDGDEISLFVP